MNDTIAAIATGAGRSAIGIVRLSGPGSLEAVEKLFTPASGRKLSQYPVGTLVYGTLRDEGRPDAGPMSGDLVQGPQATPGGHGGAPVPRLSGGAHCRPGRPCLPWGCARLRPGEFTRRAFLNGRMDLTQAEAVIDLIDAETPAAARCAASQLGGAMSRKIGKIYDQLVDLMAHFDVVLDYSDEDLEPFDEAESPPPWAGLPGS